MTFLPLPGMGEGKVATESSYCSKLQNVKVVRCDLQFEEILHFDCNSVQTTFISVHMQNLKGKGSGAVFTLCQVWVRNNKHFL